MKIGIIGSGQFGSSLAYNFTNNLKEVNLWNRSNIKRGIIIDKLNSLNGGNLINQLSPNLKLSTSLPKVVKNSDVILLCIKAQSLFSFLRDNYKFFQNKPLVFCSKGIDSETCLFQTEIGAKFLNKKYFLVLSGPGFASDIIKQKPIALSLACGDENLGKKIQKNYFFSKY
ncbi:MAG: NAD(P)-binding domain-containing protein [Paracoccaceae bacterium]